MFFGINIKIHNNRLSSFFHCFFRKRSQCKAKILEVRRAILGPPTIYFCKSSNQLHDREGKSAGLTSPGTNLQSSTFVSSRISFTLLPINVFQGSVLVIHPRTIMEFVQKYVFKGKSRASNIVEAILAPMAAPKSSNLGIVGL
ncbi:hypothetical protein CEXT_378151 [Caerostris extrusa]|uniref:Uncharacterized protein n=1 Tax=Caerostris extrusa TaxID=172846 RepID=A0AAV4STZ8_CAEEX|nr:hypothetical protein CEXT_378151 [Caerostris extrusa]